MALAPDTRRRLVGVLGLLASDKDGERAAAALLASRIVKAAGVSWDDLLRGAAAARPSAPPLYTDLEICQRHAAALTPWEKSFVAGLPRFRTRSAKQAAILARIAHELRSKGLA